jgi:alpha-glucosidase
MGLGRDPERTPMQWDDGPGAGFTTGEPWLPIADDHTRVNVRAQRDDPTSLLSLHRRLLHLRREEPALAIGDYEPVDAPGDLLAYLRTHRGRRLLVALNLGSAPASLPGVAAGSVLLSSHGAREGERVHGILSLPGDEGVVIALDA